DREDPQVVREERESRRGRGDEKVSGRFRAAQRGEEEREIAKSEQGVRARLAGVEIDQERTGQKHDERGARESFGQRARGREERGRGQKRNGAKYPVVGRSGLRDPNEHLLQNV